MPDNVLDPFLRKSQLLADLGIHSSTLDEWIERGAFPKPLVLNDGQKREIVAWLQSEYLAWKAARPRRRAAPISKNAYTETARAKRLKTLANKRTAAPELSKPRVQRPRP